MRFERIIVTIAAVVLSSPGWAQEQAELRPAIAVPEGSRSRQDAGGPVEAARSRQDAGGPVAARQSGGAGEDPGAPREAKSRQDGGAPSAEQKAVATAHVKSTEDLPNFHQVHPYLYRGGEPTAQGLKQLKDMGIRTIIDLRGSEAMVKAEADQAKKLGMKSINLPMSSKAPTPKQIDTLMKTIGEAEKDPLKGPVFVHCAHGSDRTGAMIGLWRVTHDNWDYDQTYKEMRKYYFGPKFTELSGSVRKAAEKKAAERQPAGTATR